MADGSEFRVETSLSPVATDRGTPTAVVLRDVSQQRALERAARALDVLSIHVGSAGEGPPMN